MGVHIRRRLSLYSATPARRHLRRRLGAGLVAVVVAAGLTQTGATAAGMEGSAAAGTRPVDDHHIVTLITGDRVTITNGNVSLIPGPGRAGVSFLTQRRGDHVHVIPSDALPLLRAGRLDPRLFDLTELVRAGLGNTRAELPLIVSFEGGAAARGLAPSVPGGTVVHDLPAIGGQAVRVATAETARLWDSLTGAAAARSLGPGIAKVWLDAIRQPSLDVSVPHIGAPIAWAAGYDGTGQIVAVLDSGIDESHPDLTGQVLAQANFTEGFEDDRDLVGHGTHVASTIVGTGAASGGQSRGVAPGARVLDAKVCVVFGCAESWILAGMQWAADQGATVVNLSLGGPDTPEIDPIEQAVQTLTDEYGVLFVVAAGNVPGAGTVSSPATADAALAVGAVDDADDLAFFSSQGPRAGDSAVKPDLTAPGVGITAARGVDAQIPLPYEPYIEADGTSMATPHVAGAAAILAQRHPTWGPDELKAALMASAAPHPTLTPYAQGAGRVDVARAIEQSVVTSPPSVSFGRQVWPHDDDPVLTRTVTYRNLGDAEITLALELAATGPDGAPAAAGMFTIDTTSLTVPAGGEAEVTITADTRVGSVDGLAGGRLVATAGDVVVQTPFAVNREPESYDLTLVHTDRTGESAANYFTVLARLDEPNFIDVYDPDGTATVRLPKGRYLAASVVANLETGESALLAQPRIDLNSDRVVELDAQAAAPVAITVPEPEAVGFIDVLVAARTPEFGFEFGLSGDGLFTAGLPGDGPAPYSLSSAVGTFFAPDESGFPSGRSPYVFHVGWIEDGKLFTGLRRDVRWRDLATVRAEYAVGAPGVQGAKAAWATPPEGDPMGFATVIPFDLPFVQTEYYNTDVRWAREFDEVVVSEFFLDLYSFTLDPAQQYKARRTTTEKWNHAAFAPSLPDGQLYELAASRTGDTVAFQPPIFGDATGRERYQFVESATTTVTRNGEVILEQPGLGAFFDAPPGKADYRVEVVADAGEPWTLSTNVAAAWTFTSSHVDGDKPQPLPITVIRFAPPVNLHNTVPAGQRIGVPVEVMTEPGAKTPRNKRLTVEVSFDDGQTWQRVPVVTRGGQKLAMVSHPGTPGHVSLRGTTVDVKGNTATITVIRAYRTS